MNFIVDNICDDMLSQMLVMASKKLSARILSDTNIYWRQHVVTNYLRFHIISKNPHFGDEWLQSNIFKPTLFIRDDMSWQKPSFL